MHKCIHCGREFEGDHCGCEGERKAQAMARINIDDERAQAVKAEKDRVKEINAIGRGHKVMDLAAKYIDEGKSVEEFRAAVLDKLGTKPVDLGMNQREEQAYSLTRAINVAAGIDKGDCFELEVHNEISKKLGRNSKGIFVPLNLKSRVMNAGPLTTGASPNGAPLVPHVLMPMIDILRNRMLVRQMGATVLSGLRGTIDLPRMSGASTLSWTGENPGADVGDSVETFELLTLSPKTAQANVPFTRQMLAQSSEDVEMIVRDDLIKVAAIGLDKAAISGTGAGNQPTGILNTTGIGDVAMGANGGVPDWPSIVALEGKVDTANALVGNLGYLSTPGIKSKMKTAPKDGTYPVFIWENGGSDPGFGEMNGYRAGATNQVPANLTKGTSNNCHAIIFGNWADLMIGEFGVIELIADPYSKKKQGIIEVTSFIMVDIGVRHPVSFAAIQDALAQ